MPINRELWKPPFAKLPSWLCPTCQVGSLVVDNDSLKVVETGPSEEAKDHPAWEPEWIDERFSGLLVCQNAACGEAVAIGGRTHHTEDHDWGLQEQNWERAFEPVTMYPAAPIFPIPGECPRAVEEELRRAFTLYWSDKGSSANRLRVAAEVLLTERKVPSTTHNKKGGRQRLTLHARIENFKHSDARSAELLLAIKWLGNAGSHAALDLLSGDDLLDGFELFEHVVERIYVQHEKRVERIAKRINVRKGRPAKKRGRLIPLRRAAPSHQSASNLTNSRMRGARATWVRPSATAAPRCSTSAGLPVEPTERRRSAPSPVSSDCAFPARCLPNTSSRSRPRTRAAPE